MGEIKDRFVEPRSIARLAKGAADVRRQGRPGQGEATGHAKDARSSLKAALRLNPGFSPLGSREARKALKA